METENNITVGFLMLGGLLFILAIYIIVYGVREYFRTVKNPKMNGSRNK